MRNKKTPKRLASNVSSAANPAASSATQTGSQSSILRSSFCPSRFQLSLFASVIQGLESQHLRLHDTTSGRVRCEHAIGSKATVTCLDWGFYGESHRDRHHQESDKKRKRNETVNGTTSSEKGHDVVVAYGTSESDIQLFSPAEARVVGTLKGAHVQGVRDFKFADKGLLAEGWSIGGDGKLVHWDLKKGKAIRTLTLPYGPATALCPLRSSVLCASHQAYLLDPQSREQPHAFTASTNPVHTIVNSIPRSGRGTLFGTAAKIDHFITVFSTDTPTSIGSLRTENEVLSLHLYSSHGSLNRTENTDSLEVRMMRPQEALAAVNKDGALEIFSEPFDFGSSVSQKGLDSLKARMMKRTRKATAQVKIVRPDRSSESVPIVDASFQDSEIALAWAESGVNLCFERIKWRDEGTGNLLMKEITEIVKAKRGAGIGAVTMNGVKDMGRSHVDDSHTVVANGGDADDVSMAEGEPEVIEISSGEEESESEEDKAREKFENAAKTTDGTIKQADDDDVDMEDDEQDQDTEEKEVQEAEEPSFGDLLRANAPAAVEVRAAFPDRNAQSLVPTGERGLQQLPPGMSLGTVLTQSLRTNDTNLLETCFHVRELSSVRATIERLDSSLATILLQRLAERLHSRPGRAGSLMVWIQWIVVAHGGYLNGQPDLMKRLRSLYHVVNDRANSMPALLMLKGKLDMIEAQMNLRKSMQAQSRAANALEEDDKEDVIYVEGQEGSESESDEEQVNNILDSQPAKAGAEEPALPDTDEEDREEGSESEEEIHTTTNGIIAESDDSDSEEGLFDEGASSTDHESRDEESEDEDSVDHESIESASSSDVVTSPQPKKSKLSNGTLTPKPVRHHF